MHGFFIQLINLIVVLAARYLSNGIDETFIINGVIGIALLVLYASIKNTIVRQWLMVLSYLIMAFGFSSMPEATALLVVGILMSLTSAVRRGEGSVSGGKRTNEFLSAFILSAAIIVCLLNLPNPYSVSFSGLLTYIPAVAAVLEAVLVSAWLGRKYRSLSDDAKEIMSEAERDKLTGVYNRNSLDKFVSKKASYVGPLSIIMTDMDKFKSVNDTYGHDCGDNVLKDLAKTFVTTSRAKDRVFRLGGDEFVIVCPDTSANDALRLAERFRKKFSEVKYDIGEAEPINFTLSLGVASINYGEFTTTEALIKMADTALYQAKENGRNRAVLFIDRRNSSR